MPDADGRSDATIELPPSLTKSEELPPPLVVGRERLTFSVGKRSAHVELAPLLEGGAGTAVPLLLYGLVLTVQDVAMTLRRALEMSEEQIKKGEAMQAGGALDVVVQMFERHGIKFPFADFQTEKPGAPGGGAEEAPAG